MENGLVEMAPSPASDPTTKFANMARERRRVWAQSRDSLVQTSKPEPSVPTGSQQSQSNGDSQRHPGEPGQDPNKIVSWLIDCSTPTRGSVDDQSASPIRGALRNGCSFEDDLSLGAEANHLQSTNNKSETSFGLAADQKRSQYKERGRSMNSTGSGKSSTVSSVSELLDLYEEDPEEILLNLGFGREEPDLSSKVPSRFFGSSSSARGIDIKVFLGAQMQRMELENPNYALTSRFRQIEVLTTVANEFFQLYSQVSGQPVRRISKEQGEGEEEGGGGGGNDEDQSPMLKRNNSALNVAKFLKKTLTRHNLLSAASESPGEASPNQDKQQKENATTPNPAHINGHKQSGPEQGRCGSGSDHQGEVVSQKQIRKKDNRLEMVIEETSGGGETDQPLDSNPEQSGSEHQPESADLQTTNQRKEVEGNQVAKEETNITSPPVTAASSLAPLNLVQLCTENADSFDIEEIQTNEDEALPHRISRTTDFSRTVSQQSDSSGFAEEPSVDSNSNLKVQESSDSCDSETTVTSHPSQDVATPHALDQPAFDLPDGKKEEGELGDAANTDGRSRSSEEDTHGGSSEQVPQYTVHHLLKDQPAGEGEQVDVRDIINPDTEHQPELEHTQNEPEQEPQHSEMTADTETPTKGPEDMPLDNSGSLAPSSPVLDALNRAKRNQLCLMGQNSIQSTDMSQTPGGRGRGRRIIPMQRSSSLPSSLLLPSKVVSSVKIQFRQGQASCTPPRYSFKYTQEAGEEVKEDDEEEKQTNCLSTVFINPRSKENPSAGISPKPVSPNLLRSSCSLHSTSPPAHLSAGGHTQPWSTQSVPDLTFSHHQPGPFNQNQQIWSPGQGMYPTQSPSTVFSDPSPYPSPNFNSGLFPFSTYPYVRPPYLTNQHNLSLNHYSSLTSLHQPLSPLIPAHSNNLHQPPVSTAPYHQGLGHLRSGTSPAPHQVYSHQGYSHPYSHHLPYPITPHNSQYSSPYQGTPVFNMSPLFHSGLGPSAASGLEPGRCQSSTEMQLRKVLHEIRGTVQSLNQSRVNTPDTFSDLRGTSQQSLAEFQQKRRSLNIFRSQMMDLELAVMRQEALVYKHLSPADRLEAEQLQSLRSAVRQELQELEQQVEDHLMDLTSNLHDTALHRNSSLDNLSTASALRAMEPVSDLLRQQFFLQSELIYDGHGSASDPSARSPSPIRGDEGDGKQRQGVYRASVNITPAPPPRPNTNTEEDEGEREEDDRREERAEEDSAGKEGAAGKIGVDSIQQLIREIRESVAQQVRREIYQELLAAASPQDSSSRQKPL